MKLFKCFRKQKEIKSKDTRPMYENTLDSDNRNHKELLFNQLSEMIGYDKNLKIDIVYNIQDLRTELEKHFWAGVIPMYFQQTFYINTKEKLKYVIFNELHSKNVSLIIQMLNQESEDSLTE